MSSLWPPLPDPADASAPPPDANVPIFDPVTGFDPVTEPSAARPVETFLGYDEPAAHPEFAGFEAIPEPDPMQYEPVAPAPSFSEDILGAGPATDSFGAFETEAVAPRPHRRIAGRLIAAVAGLGVLFGGAFALIHLVESFTADEPAVDAAQDEPAPTPTPEPTPDEPEPEPEIPQVHVTVATAAANIRGGPSQGAGIVGSIPNGASVEITGPPENGWYPVSFHGQIGWTFGAFLASPDFPEVPMDPDNLPEQPTTAMASIASNIRSGPGNNHGIVGTVRAGAQLEITGDPVNGWFPVQAGDVTGWIFGTLLRF